KHLVEGRVFGHPDDPGHHTLFTRYERQALPGVDLPHPRVPDPNFNRLHTVCDELKVGLTDVQLTLRRRRRAGWRPVAGRRCCAAERYLRHWAPIPEIFRAVLNDEADRAYRDLAIRQPAPQGRDDRGGILRCLAVCQRDVGSPWFLRE